ncbi:S8 family serine peptidase [Nocardioides marinquilinus]|uniref:S8 family serine peptidase n=1 Tax=Nocardioides marinquilinus TaxID=1210400 RepID=A0ABP9Q795_9ACTN
MVAPRRPLVAATALAALAATALAGVPGPSVAAPATTVTSAAPAPSGPAGPDRLAGPRTVTLVTGHRVTLTPGAGRWPEVVVEGAGRFGDVRVGREDDGVVTVLPERVAALVPGVLDPRLFDVTGLVEMGYDDASRAGLPLVVHRPRGVARLAPGAVVEPQASLPSIRGTAVELSKTDAGAFARGLARVAARPTQRSAVTAATLGGFDRVWLDARTRATSTPAAPAAPDGPLHPYLDQIGVTAADGAGLDGSGVEVAVLDTGVDAGHPALADVTVTARDFTGTGTDDAYGHGTHVASLVAGDGAGSGPATGGVLRGVAPGVDLLSGKVLDDDGFGQESWLVAGLEWAVAQGADVVNVSLTAPPSGDGSVDDPAALAVDALSAGSDTLFVVAAGDAGAIGPDPGTIGSPGTAAAALTVTSISSAGRLSRFASEGPVRGSERAKPDLGAPGEEIPGARAGARAGDADPYVALSGTSQATALVAGAAALLREQHPAWDGERLKQVLASTAAPLELPGGGTTGSGLLSVPRAIDPPALVSPGPLGFGLLPFDDSTVAQTFTVTNPTDAVLALRLVPEAIDAYLQPAPDGFATVDADTLTLEPGASSEVTLTLDPRASVEYTRWYGRVRVLADDEPLLDVPFTAHDLPELFEVDLTVLDRTGAPADGLVVPLQDVRHGGYVNARVTDGHAVARVPAGTWSAIGRVVTPAAPGRPESLTIAGDNGFEVSPATGDVAVTIDARRGRAVGAPSVAGDATRPTQFLMTYESMTSEGGGYIETVLMPVGQVQAGGLFVEPMAPAPAGRSASSVRWQLRATGTRAPGEPETYELHRRRPGLPDVRPTRLTRADVARLARVTTRFHQVGYRGRAVVGLISEHGGIGLVERRSVQLPRRVVSLVTADPAAVWASTYEVPAGSGIEATQTMPRSYRPGSRTVTALGRAVHPGLVSVSGTSFGSLYVETGLDDGVAQARVDDPSVLDSRLVLFRDGERVDAGDDTFRWFQVPAAPASYRLVSDLVLRRSVPVTARTVWRFRSRGAREQEGSFVPPALTVDYGPHVGMRGSAPARRALRFALRVGHQPGSTAPGSRSRIVSARLRWSVDGGRTWRGGPVQRVSADRFRAVVPGDVLHAGRTVSTWLHATDAAGNEIDQRLRDVVRIRPAG